MLELQVLVSAVSHTLTGEDLIQEQSLAGCWPPTPEEIRLVQDLFLPAESLNLIGSFDLD